MSILCKGIHAPLRDLILDQLNILEQVVCFLRYEDELPFFQPIYELYFFWA